MEVKCRSYTCASVPKFRNKPSEANESPQSFRISRGSPPDSKRIPAEIGQQSTVRSVYNREEEVLFFKYDKRNLIMYKQQPSRKVEN